MCKVASKREQILQHLEKTRCPAFASTLSQLFTTSLGTRRGRIIGAGGSSNVTVEMDPTTGKLLAVKHLSFPLHISVLIREVEHLSRLNHPNVLRIVGWAFEDSSHSAEIQTEYMANGSLDRVFDQVRRGEPPAFWNATGIGILICGIVLGMRYIHMCGVIHRDLKPGNILLNEKGHPLIGDFGGSRLESDEATPSGECGTVCYAAPEQYVENAVQTAKMDVFSFGLIVYELLVGSPVFSPSDSPFTVIRRLRDEDLAEIPVSCGSMMGDLISRCWRRNPEDRPSFDEIFSQFRAHGFNIVANAVSGEIEDFCDAILEWEHHAGLVQ
jgi:aurora kinase